ncbi:MAG: polysaccharide deacetylase family protein [Flavobacteriales bacterium]|nr:polysaccharide deacetylase family protein [Flavobacteriales bacterium]
MALHPKPPKPRAPGGFIISLDLELLWGVRDKRTVDSYGNSIRGGRTAIPRMLECFDQYEVKATFATVGLLFHRDRESMMAGLPTIRPTYVHGHLSPYNGHFDQVGVNEEADPYHFGHALLSRLLAHPGHEVGCHTFSHYYCLEAGQTPAQFEADMAAAVHAASRMGITLRSLVFPRNQYNPAYLNICRQFGIEAYRGNERSWAQVAKSSEEETLVRRGVRLLDTWINLTGHNCHPWPNVSAGLPVNIPSSRFLRPWNKHTRWLEGLRLRRITKAMDHAACTGTLFHLWWHPHNFGRNLEENMAFLGKVLEHYGRLRGDQGMESLTMGEVASRSIAQAHGS